MVNQFGFIMSRRVLVISVMILSLSLLVAMADAHIPVVPNDGTTIATATEIIEPWKSWFYYSALESDVPHYYSFEATAGERIRFMLNVPIPEGDRGFSPNMVLMGPGVSDQGTPPGFLEIPGGVGVMVLEADTLEAEYEGFTPLSQYTTVDLNMSAPTTGTYYIAVYEDGAGGRYALVTGYVEAYSVFEWIIVPSMAMTIIMWSGQNIWFILLPMLLPLMVGMIYLAGLNRDLFTKVKLASLVGIMGGLLFLGSSMSFFLQMTLALLQAPYNWTVILSIVFATIPLILGVAVLRTVSREDWMNQRTKKIVMIAVGLVALFTWTGLYMGPLLVIVAGLIPSTRTDPS
jgi:hypothetical protein